MAARRASEAAAGDHSKRWRRLPSRAPGGRLQLPREAAAGVAGGREGGCGVAGGREGGCGVVGGGEGGCGVAGGGQGGGRGRRGGEGGCRGRRGQGRHWQRSPGKAPVPCGERRAGIWGWGGILADEESGWRRNPRRRWDWRQVGGEVVLRRRGLYFSDRIRLTGRRMAAVKVWEGRRDGGWASPTQGHAGENKRYRETKRKTGNRDFVDERRMLWPQTLKTRAYSTSSKYF
nr:glycine-rich cell wall structural protein 1.8-like [Lolium perenne]